MPIFVSNVLIFTDFRYDWYFILNLFVYRHLNKLGMKKLFIQNQRIRTKYMHAYMSQVNNFIIM